MDNYKEKLAELGVEMVEQDGEIIVIVDDFGAVYANYHEAFIGTRSVLAYRRSPANIIYPIPFERINNG